jgi:hypothetical protein
MPNDEANPVPSVWRPRTDATQSGRGVSAGKGPSARSSRRARSPGTTRSVRRVQDRGLRGARTSRRRFQDHSSHRAQRPSDPGDRALTELEERHTPKGKLVICRCLSASFSDLLAGRAACALRRGRWPPPVTGVVFPWRYPVPAVRVLPGFPAGSFSVAPRLGEDAPPARAARFRAAFRSRSMTSPHDPHR